MKRFLYLIGFLVFLLILKAFYLDPYIAENYGDKNTSSEANKTEIAPVDEPVIMKEENTTQKETYEFAPKEKMPVDQLGDSIANKLQGKIRKY